MQSLLAYCTLDEEVVVLQIAYCKFPGFLFAVLKQILKQSGLHRVGYINKPFTYTKYSWLQVLHSVQQNIIYMLYY